MRITNSANCPVADCTVDLGPTCKWRVHLSGSSHTVKSGPQPLQGPFDSSGFPVGCKSACFANLDGNPRALRVSRLTFQANKLTEIQQRTRRTVVPVHIPLLQPVLHPASSSTTSSVGRRSESLCFVLMSVDQRATAPTRTPMHMMSRRTRRSGPVIPHSTRTTR